MLPARWRTALMGATAAALLLSAGCAEVNLDEILSSDPTPTPTAIAVPSGMVMPDVPPTAQPTAPSAVTVSFPDLPGYEAQPETVVSHAADSDLAGSSTVRTWVSRQTMCTVRAEVTTSAALLLAGGDDRFISGSWADAAADSYSSYEQTSRRRLEGANGDMPFHGIGTSFTARVAGSDVTGSSFVRVWSADGVVVSLTELCQLGEFDQETWVTLRHGVRIEGLSGVSAWPGGESEPTGHPTGEPTQGSEPTPTGEPTATATSAAA